MENVVIRKVDYNNDAEAQQLLEMLNVYALDEQGGGEELEDYTKQNLIKELRKSSIAVSFLAYKGEEPIGLANCFYAFSTFSAKSILNVHDLAVKDGQRGLGVGTKLLQAVEDEAKAKGCCKVTLEVLEQNTRAKRVYESFGFAGYNFGDGENNALFWQKKIV